MRESGERVHELALLWGMCHCLTAVAQYVIRKEDNRIPAAVKQCHTGRCRSENHGTH